MLVKLALAEMEKNSSSICQSSIVVFNRISCCGVVAALVVVVAPINVVLLLKFGKINQFYLIDNC